MDVRTEGSNKGFDASVMALDKRGKRRRQARPDFLQQLPVINTRKFLRPLATIDIPDYYIRQGETRRLRPYQQETMRAMDQAFELGERRFFN